MSSGPDGQPSLVRTGAKAGAAFIGSVVKGGLLSLILGGGAFFYLPEPAAGPGQRRVRAARAPRSR